MKHLVRKNIMSTKVGSNVVEIIKKASIDEKKIDDISNLKMDNKYALALTEDNLIIQTFKYVNNEKVFFIQEPNPIVIYFDTARHFHKTIYKDKSELFKNLTILGNNVNAVNGNFYLYFSNICSYTIFLFLSIEAFINKTIPNDYEYKKKIQNKKTELYDNYQIQRGIDFLEKIKIVLPDAVGKNFVQKFSHKYDLIKNLKDFRDEIVHTKSFEGKESPNFYKDLFVKSLDFEHDKTMLAVRDFINFYEPNLIEECQCGSMD